MVSNGRVFVKIITGILGTGSSPVLRFQKTGRIFFPPDWGMLRRSRRVLIFL